MYKVLLTFSAVQKGLNEVIFVCTRRRGSRTCTRPFAPSMSARPVRVLVINSLYVVGEEAGPQLLENDGRKLNLQVRFFFSSVILRRSFLFRFDVGVKLLI